MPSLTSSSSTTTLPLLLLLLASTRAAADSFATIGYNGLAVTPQMGWDNWNAFGCSVSESLILTTAQRIAALGLRDAGYNYVILDDCYQDPAGRTTNGTLKVDASKFPRGIKALADDVHGLGLKWGMYSSAGKYTCGKYTASLGYEKQDADTFASWGVDYLKYDNCYNEGQSGTPLITYTRYAAMSSALNATSRPILYSMCNWGEDSPWNWAQTMANSWRISGDITDKFNTPDIRCPCTSSYDCNLPGYHCSVMNILNKQAAFPSKSEPGGWSDLDMLEVGNGGMTDAEYVLHMTMWAAVKSPLIMGNDLAALPPSAYSILTNPAILAISQDPLGQSVVRKWRYVVDDDDFGAYADSGAGAGGGEISMWAGQLAGGDYVVILLNAGGAARAMNATLAHVFEDNGGARSPQAQSGWDLYDLWAGRMPESVAAQVLATNSTAGLAANGTAAVANATVAQGAVGRYFWNATAVSYADGIAANVSMLMGTRVGSVAALGTVTATVERHGVVAYRLRPRGAPLSRKRDEL